MCYGVGRCRQVSARGYEVAQAKRVARPTHMLLAQEGDALSCNDDVVAIAVGLGKEYQGMAYGLVGPLAQQLRGLPVESVGLR